MSDKQPDKRAQSQKFIDKAKELGCDEDEDAFEQKLRGIAKVKSEPQVKGSLSKSAQKESGGAPGKKHRPTT